MGKVNKNKKKNTLNGVKNGKPKANKSKASNEGETSQELHSTIPTDQILAYLQKPNIEEKVCGFQMMATLIEGDECKNIISNKSILKAATHLLNDDSSIVRCAAAGTLRNISALGMDFSESLIEEDTMTPLVTFFKKHSHDWRPKLSPTGKLDDEAEAFLHCIHLLWNLCECSGIPIRYVNASKLVTLLKRCLNVEVFGTDIVIAVLHCLCVILEDNPEAISEVKSSENELKSLCSIDIQTQAHLLIKILALAALIYLKDIKSLSSDEVFLTMNCITEVLSKDVRQSCGAISSSLPVNNPVAENQKLHLDCELQKKIDDLKHTIDAQQTALEIVTNMCSEDDDSANDEEDSDEIYFDEDVSNSNGNDVDMLMSDKLPIELIEAITAASLVKLVWTKTTPLPENVTEILNDSDEGKNIKKRFFILQSRALFCMNNMITNLPVELLEGFQGIYNIWVKTGEVIFKKDNPIDNESIFESGTAVMRAVLTRFNLKNDTDKSQAFELFKNLQVTDIQLILEGINQCQNPKIRTNLTRMLGSLAQILSHQGQSEVLVHLSDFLTTRAFKETELWVMADALDTLMDVFAEDETDLLAAQVNLIDKMTSLLPIFKIKLNDERKTLGDHYPTVSTVATNLPRFIKYKRHRITKIINP